MEFIKFRFNDSNGKEYILGFKNIDEARKYAYVHGLCFLGRL